MDGVFSEVLVLKRSRDARVSFSFRIRLVDKSQTKDQMLKIIKQELYY